MPKKDVQDQTVNAREPGPLTREDAERFLADPASRAQMPDSADTVQLYAFLQRHLEQGRELMEENGLGLLDCVYLGDTSLRQLYEKTYRAQVGLNGEAQIESFMLKVMAAKKATLQEGADFTAYMTIPAQEQNGFGRRVVPITPSGNGFADQREPAGPGQGANADAPEEWDRVRSFGEQIVAQEEQRELEKKLDDMMPDKRMDTLVSLHVCQGRQLLKDSEVKAKDALLKKYYWMGGELEEKLEKLHRTEPGWEEKRAQKLQEGDFLKNLRQPSYRSVELKQVKDLGNLFERAMDTDRMNAHARLHKNSDEWKALTGALKELYRFQQELERGKRDALTPKEQRRVEELMSRVAEKAGQYLADKDTKPRESEMGQARYMLAFAALHVCNPAKAKVKLELNNGRFPMTKQTPQQEIEKLAGTYKPMPDRTLALGIHIEELQEGLSRTQDPQEFARGVAAITYYGGLRRAYERGNGPENYSQAASNETADAEINKLMGSEGFQRLLSRGMPKLRKLAMEKDAAGLVKAAAAAVGPGYKAPDAQIGAVTRESTGPSAGMYK
ncbi:MAG: hypothetical protein IKS07_07625 [Lachnospiraceae bacterium]|nr:hypothetical protein [Lachnospiraceae bacterium]